MRETSEDPIEYKYFCGGTLIDSETVVTGQDFFV